MLTSCSDDETIPSFEVPADYSFLRNGNATVDFSGQTTRILMGEALNDALLDFTASAPYLLELYRNETEDGQDANPFGNALLNESTKSIKSKVAASADYFATNSALSASIKQDFEIRIDGQVSEVFPHSNTLAEPGKAGQIADGDAVRYVNASGLEYDQMIIKGLIGALMTDQALNHYLSKAVLDANNNIDDNNAGIAVEGKPYTDMEHKWDEAYGYVYGLSADPTRPNDDLGSDSFLNKYIGRMEGDDDFAGIAEELFEAFKRGRAAIVAKEYAARDEQAEIIREKISEIIGVRAVYYMQQAKIALPDDRTQTEAYGGALHDLSEGYGFIYSLQFTRMPNSAEPYFTHSEVNALLEKLLGDGANGLWDIEENTLDEISESIAAKFRFTVEQAGA